MDPKTRKTFAYDHLHQSASEVEDPEGGDHEEDRLVRLVRVETMEVQSVSSLRGGGEYFFSEGERAFLRPSQLRFSRRHILLRLRRVLLLRHRRITAALLRSSARLAALALSPDRFRLGLILCSSLC
jgi:hypothetical protein